MAIDVTDATFQADVIDKSSTVPVVVDLWAPWCGPCRTLGPILEKVVDATEGEVVLTKVNVDENPQISGMFRVQSIPAVYAMRNGQVVDGFLGAVPERDVERFVQTLLPTEEQTTVASLIAAGDEAEPAQGDRARSGQRGRRRRPGDAARRAAAVRRSAGPARTDPRVGADPADRRGRPAGSSRRRVKRRATTTTPR